MAKAIAVSEALFSYALSLITDGADKNLFMFIGHFFLDI